MPKPAAAAVSQQQRLQCLQRLQHLQTQFLHIDSPAELADAKREGGHILAQLLHGKHIEPDLLLLNPAGQVFLFDRGKPVATSFRDGLLYLASNALKHRKTYVGLAISNAKSEDYCMRVWESVVDNSELKRTIERPVVDIDKPLPKGVYDVELDSSSLPSSDTSEPKRLRWLAYPVEDGKKQNTPIKIRGWQTFPDRDYRQQGKRYSLFCAELLARLSIEQPSGSTDAKPKQGYTDRGLAVAIGRVIADESKEWTAKAVAAEINRLNPDRYVGSTTVGKHPQFQAYLDEQGKRRPGRKTGKPKTITASGDILDSLLNKTRRKTKPPAPDNRDEEY